MMKYDVETTLYEGPLSLLVELAKLRLLDVFLLQLRSLTQHYLVMVKEGGSSLNDLAEPLPLLGQLVALKARSLLPQAAPLEDDEEPISLEELERRLREYEQFKTVAQLLAELHALQHEHFTRTQSQASPPEIVASEASEPSEAPVEVGIMDLMTAFARVLKTAKSPVYEVVQDLWTVEMKVEELTLMLQVRRQVGFLEVFSPEKSKLELVVTFLALLELVRQRVCLAVQQRVFGDIVIVRRQEDR